MHRRHQVTVPPEDDRGGPHRELPSRQPREMAKRTLERQIVIAELSFRRVREDAEADDSIHQIREVENARNGAQRAVKRVFSRSTFTAARLARALLDRLLRSC